MMFSTPADFPAEVDAVISPASHNSIGIAITNLSSLGAPASAAWPTAAKAFYIPFALDRAVTLFRVGWHNGSAAQSGTREVGVYSAAGVKIISGSATPATINVVQFVDVTDTILGPGVYYMAMMDAGVITTVAWAPVVPQVALMGVYTQTSASPLPSTATFAVDNAVTFLPIPFLQCRSVA